MKKKFEDPIRAPLPPLEYDKRSSVFVRMGDDYGSVKTNNVGHVPPPKETVETFPTKCRMIIVDGEKNS
jgi:hypothetical protein